MPEPITPKVGSDTFVLNDKEQVCLIRRSDNGLWALPGGYQDLGEAPAECAKREFFEETGYHIQITELLGVFSSLKYPATTNVNRSREVTHILFAGELIEGGTKTSAESIEIGWFLQIELPALSEGHAIRIDIGFRKYHGLQLVPYYE